jgi:hypothetical protein
MSINIPELYNSFPFKPRDNQLEIACEIIEAFENHKHVILNAPTGVGKSVIAMAITQYYSKITSIVTSEKILQDQYTSDFGSLNDVVSVKGMNAYKCPIDGKEVTEAACRLLGVKDCEEPCEYHRMLKNRRLKYWITNYNIALTNPFFLKRDHFLLIADEMHKIESILLGTVTCTIGIGFIDALEKRVATLNKINNMTFATTTLYELYHKCKNQDTNNIQFFYDIFQDFNYSVSRILIEINGVLNFGFSDIKNKKYDELTDLEKDRLKLMKYLLNTSILINTFVYKFELLYRYINKIAWIVETTEKEVIFKPVYANLLFNDVINILSEKFLYMSATSYCKSMFCSEYKVPHEDVYEISIDSPFPVNNRKVYTTNFANMSYNNIKESQVLMLECIDAILDNIQCRSVVHTGNYSLAMYISSHSRHGNRIVAPKSGQREFLIETQFKQKPNGVLVSPSLIEGLSLNDDMCRVQIVAKIPYTSLADKRVQIRAATNPIWYSQEAIFKVVQSSGRGVRHKDDYCITFILDSAFSRLYNMYNSIFPFWFLNAIEQIKPNEIIPKVKDFMSKHLITEKPNDETQMMMFENLPF